jgi:hypothetical protein
MRSFERQIAWHLDAQDPIHRALNRAPANLAGAPRITTENRAPSAQTGENVVPALRCRTPGAAPLAQGQDGGPQRARPSQTRSVRERPQRRPHEIRGTDDACSGLDFGYPQRRIEKPTRDWRTSYEVTSRRYPYR